MLKYNLVNYRQLLKKIITYNYSFIKYPTSTSDILNKSRQIILRHDIDFSLDAALKIAIEDHNIGIQSTFFIYLNTPFYNIFFENDSKKINKIRMLGHDIALHLDQRSKFHFEKDLCILKNKFPDIRLDIISLHKPIFNKKKIILSKKVNITTTYDDQFFNDIEYISDSRCNFNYNKLDNILSSSNNLQLLLHPLWWFYKGDSIEEKLFLMYKNRTKEMINKIHKDISINFNL